MKEIKRYGLNHILLCPGKQFAPYSRHNMNSRDDLPLIQEVKTLIALIY